MLIPAILLAVVLLSGCATFRPGFTGKPEVNVGEVEGHWKVSISSHKTPHSLKRNKGIFFEKEF